MKINQPINKLNRFFKTSSRILCKTNNINTICTYCARLNDVIFAINGWCYLF